MLFKKGLNNVIENQAKYGLTKGASCIITLLKNSLKIMMLRCTQYIMKENLSLPKGLLEHWKAKFLDTWQLFQRMFTLMCLMILLINTITQFIEQLK